MTELMSTASVRTSLMQEAEGPCHVVHLQANHSKYLTNILQVSGPQEWKEAIIVLLEDVQWYCD